MVNSIHLVHGSHSNPYAPGAGTEPPELAGREPLLETVRIAIERTRKGLATRSVLLIGLRGVGKTVLLNRMRLNAQAAGVHALQAETPEGRSLPGLLAPHLRKELIALSRVEQAKEAARRGLAVLAGFVNAFKVKYSDIEIGLEIDPEHGVADNGDLDQDLPELIAAVGSVAQAADTALALFVDELQYVKDEQLAALITAMHHAAQARLPVLLVGAGLPQLRGQTGKAKSYAERLFEFHEIGALSSEAARVALAKPAQDLGVDFEAQAIRDVLAATERYPYFLQEWGKHVWNVAGASPITERDAQLATEEATAALDTSFFRVRFDRLTPSEKRYLRAMAELGPGPHRSGDVSAVLRRPVTSLGPVRAKLINKGMAWSPSHGDIAFTVPMFDAFMKRIMLGDGWRTE